MNPFIIFDYGAVLVKSNYGKVYTAFTELSTLPDKSPERMKELYTRSNMDLLLNTGAITTKEFCNRVRRLLKTTIADQEIIDAYTASIDEPISEVIKLKQTLHQQGYRIGILATVSEINYLSTIQRFPEVFKVYGEDDIIKVSYQEHITKPALEAYLPFGRGNHIIFIDDKLAYLETPVMELGWQGIHFTPYIDKNEAMRAVQGHNTSKKLEGIVTANNFEALVAALRMKGVNV